MRQCRSSPLIPAICTGSHTHSGTSVPGSDSKPAHHVLHACLHKCGPKCWCYRRCLRHCAEHHRPHQCPQLPPAQSPRRLLPAGFSGGVFPLRFSSNPDPSRPRSGGTVTPHAPVVPSTSGARLSCFSRVINDIRRLVLAGKSGCSGAYAGNSPYSADLRYHVCCRAYAAFKGRSYAYANGIHGNGSPRRWIGRRVSTTKAALDPQTTSMWRLSA